MISAFRTMYQRRSWSACILAILFCTLAAVGCTGSDNDDGDSGGSDSPGTYEGVFVDSPVAGLNYESPSCSGTTAADGSFGYNAGETVTFRIGDIVLGSAAGRGRITPLELVPEARDETHPAVVNIARLLQSLDNDGQFEDVIRIPAQVPALLQGFAQIDFDQPADDFSSDATVLALFDLLNGQGVFGDRTAALIDADAALAHLQATLVRYPMVVVLRTPNGGEHLVPGGDAEIVWQAPSAMEQVTLLISDDSGATWRDEPIVADIPNDGSYIWQSLPADLSGSCFRIRVIQSAGAEVTGSSVPHDDSDSDFSIYLSMGDVEQWIADSLAGDSDGDYLPDDVEALLGTDPNNRDSDHDGIFDYNEIFTGMTYSLSAPLADGDADGLVAVLDADDDGDGQNDGLLVDSDGDGIPNLLEFYGYTYDWFSDSYALWDGVSYDITYFKTDPLQSSTDQDPYGDAMEASGSLMDVLISPPGDLPMVPAYPNIVVRLEGYDVTLNAEINYAEGGSLGQEKTWSRETSVESAFETGLSWETGVTATIGAESGAELSASVGGSLGFSLSTGSTRSTGGSVTSESNWEKAISSNPAEAAHLKLKLKVYNAGTAAASYISPTLTLKIGGMSVLTFKPADTVNILEPGGAYPAQTGTYWVVDKTDAGDAITLTLDELRALECGAPINISMTQLSADVMLMNDDGQWESAGDWSQYIARCEAVGANIKIDAGAGNLIHHLVYADDAATAPTVTFGDALSWIAGYDQNADHPRMVYTDGDGVVQQTPLSDWHFIVDTDTLTRNGLVPGQPIGDPDFVLTDLVLGPDSAIVARAPRDTAGSPLPEIYFAYYDTAANMVKVSAGDYNGIASATFIDHCGDEHGMGEVLAGSGMFLFDTSDLTDCDGVTAFEPIYADDEGLLLERVVVTSTDGLVSDPQYLTATYIPEREPEVMQILGVSIKPDAGTIDITLDFDPYFPPSRVYFIHPKLDNTVHELTKHPMYWHKDFYNHWVGELPADWNISADQLSGMWIVAEVDGIDCEIDHSTANSQSGTCFASYIVQASDVRDAGQDSGTLNLYGWWTQITLAVTRNYYAVDFVADSANSTCQTLVDYIEGDGAFIGGPLHYGSQYDLVLEPDGVYLKLVAPYGFIEVVERAFEDIDDAYIRTTLSGAVFNTGAFYSATLPIGQQPTNTWVLKAGPGGNVYIVVTIKAVGGENFLVHTTHYAEISYVVYDLDAAVP